MEESIVSRLTAKDDQAARAFAEKIIAESRESDVWYGHLDAFVPLLEHPRSYVRNRALHILAANARWDREGRYDAVLPKILSHITDEKPITARQCIQALVTVGQAKPREIPRIVTALRQADLTVYRDTMRPLLEKDRQDAENALARILRMAGKTGRLGRAESTGAQEEA